MKICVVGLGYIGLPTAAMLASRGHEVVGYDVSERVVAAVTAGEAHFQEPDLQMLLSAAVGTGRLKATTSPEPADFFVIAVPTPIQPGGAPDMSYVESAAESIAPVLAKGCTVILESTSPVGSTEKLAAALAAARPDLVFPRYKQDDIEADVAVCHCPERILPGRMMTELVSNDRIIGGLSWTCSDRALELYNSFVMGTCYVTDARTAELVKLAENAFRDVNIAFANELSMICERLEVDVWAVRELANRHPRVEILRPGAGVGGHCIAVDPWFIVHSAPDDARLIRTARTVNDDKPRRIIRRVNELADRFKAPVIACYGITYKPDVDDVRESPAIEIVEQIAALGHKLLVCEPNLAALPHSLAEFPNVTLVDAGQAQREADIAVFLVGHRQFRRVELDAFLGKAVVDAIGLLSRPAVSVT
jgi:UDP-N-acetyl-D-mannosaminuronic acid dehydrogenase